MQSDDYEEMTVMRSVPQGMPTITAVVEAFARETAKNPAAVDSPWLPVVNQLIDVLGELSALPDESAPLTALLAATSPHLNQIVAHANANNHADAARAIAPLVTLGTLGKRIAALPR